MGKAFSRKSLLLVTLVLVFQLAFPFASTLAATYNSSILPPSNLTSQMITPDDVKLSWSAVYGATGYNVYGITEGQLTLLGTTATNSYTLNNLPEGSYTYVVSTLSADGESGPGAPVDVTIVYPEMAAPATFSHTIQNFNDIVLSWSASTYAESYNLYQIGADGQNTLLSTTASRSYTVKGISEGTYKFAVSASNSLYGESAPSTPLQAEVVFPVMAAPANLTYTVTNGNDLNLKWNSASYANNYRVYQMVDGQPVLKSTVTGTGVTYVNMPAGEYTYKVYSYSDRFGESPEGSSVSLTMNEVTLAAPGNASYKIQNLNDVVLTWGSVLNANSYKVYQIIDGQPVLKSTVTGTTITYTNQPAGAYEYKIYSYSDRFGQSAEGSDVSLTLGDAALAAPSNLTFKIQNLNDIVLSWGSVPYATNYKVYQIVDGEQVLKSTVASTSVTYAKMPAGDYVFKVYAYSDRYGQSPEGATVSLTLGAVEMLPPGNLAYKIQNQNDIVLTWSSAANATSYKVYQIVDGQQVLKSTVTGTSVTYTKMAAGDYVFKVYSYSDRFGESAEGSIIELTVEAVTVAPPSNFTYKIQNLNDIVLSWTAAPNATNYKVYQIVNGQPVLKSTLTGTTVTYTNMPAGDYTYKIYTYSDRFGESAEASTVSFTLEQVVMVPPSDLAYKIQNGNDIVLTWSSAANATSYKVYQIVNGQKVLKSSLSGTTVTYTNMPEGQYDYVVHSLSTRFGESQEGSELSFALVHPDMQPPANVVQVIKNATDFTLNWEASEYATNYKVYQIVNGGKVLKSTVTGTTETYTNMSPGEYTYEVHSYSSRFGESVEGSQLTFMMNGQTMPAPADLTYTISNGNDIALKWTAVQYAANYKIYQVIDGQKVLKSTVTGTTVTYTNLPEGDYSYIVHSVSTLFGESPEGAEVTIPLVHPNIEAPEGFQYKISNGNDIVLSWQSVQYASSYKVYKVIGEEKVLKSTVSSLTTTLTNAAEGEHTYIVHAVSTRFGESEQGSRLTFEMVHPDMQAPANPAYTISNGNDITLKWSSVQYANSYKIYQIVDGKKVLKNTVTSTSFTYINMPEDDYKYEIHSYSSRFGESEDGRVIAFALIHPIMQAPANPTHTVLNGNDFTLRWNTATYATAYKVYQIVDGQKVLKKTLTVTSLAFTNMPEGDYKFEIHSYSDRFGESPKAAELSFTLTWPVVQPPKQQGSVFNVNNITLSWQAVTWANEYRVYQITGDNRQLIYKGTALTYKVYNLTEDTHSFEVTAYSTRFGESEPSNRITEKIVYPDMQSPTASLTLLSETSARITWNFVTYANGYNVYEIVDGKPVLLVHNLNNLSFTVNDLSYANHEYYVTSFSNSFGESGPSNIVMAKLIVDTEPPVTSVNAPTDWTNRFPIVTLSATDNETGVANTYYSINGSEYTAGTSFDLNEEGIHKVSFYSVDKVGNIEAAKTVDIKIDQTAPTTEASDIPEWSAGSIAIELRATDTASGVAKTFYSVNGSDYAEGTSFTLDKEGINQVSYYSVDLAGNIEEVRSVVVKIDRTAPVTVIDAPEGWSKEDAAVELKAADELSGVAKTFYSVNGSAYTEGTSFTVSKEGINQVSYYSVDAAGNVEEVKTIEVKIDKSAPVITMNVNGEYALGSTLQLTYTANDDLSGIVSESMVVTGPNGAETVLANGGNISFDLPGSYSVTVTATNAAGLSAKLQKQFVVYIPASIEVTPKIIKGNNGVFTVRVELPKGFGSARFDLNTATLNGIKALSSNNGYYNQAKQGQFKFERSDFNWTTSEVLLEFRCIVDGKLVVGSTTVKVQK